MGTSGLDLRRHEISATRGNRPMVSSLQIVEWCRKSPADLKDGELSQLYRHMGRLADWWLGPELHRRLQQLWPGAAAAPRLPDAAGSCWIIIAQDESSPWPALRPAFLLPLQWVKDSPDSPRLPPKLQELARCVAESVHNPNWGLRLSGEAGLEDVDLSPFNAHLKFDSGWAALAGGLLLAIKGGRPDPKVWASGAWNNRDGIQKVGHLKQKLQLAIESGAQADEARDILRRVSTNPSAIAIEELACGVFDPQRALQNYLYRLDAPPPPPRDMHDENGLKQCVKYYMRQPQQPEKQAEKTKAYYRDNILPTIIQRCQHQLRQDYPDWQPQVLVTVVSKNPELVLIAARTLNVRRCLLLHTPDSEQSHLAAAISRQLEEDGTCVFAKPWSDPNDPDRMIGALPIILREFLHDTPPQQVVTDLTPGTKLMTYALSRTAPPGSWLMYIKNETPNGRVEPGNEKIIRWQVENSPK